MKRALQGLSIQSGTLFPLYSLFVILPDCLSKLAESWDLFSLPLKKESPSLPSDYHIKKILLIGLSLSSIEGKNPTTFTLLSTASLHLFDFFFCAWLGLSISFSVLLEGLAEGRPVCFIDLNRKKKECVKHWSQPIFSIEIFFSKPGIFLDIFCFFIFFTLSSSMLTSCLAVDFVPVPTPIFKASSFKGLSSKLSIHAKKPDMDIRVQWIASSSSPYHTIGMSLSF